MRLISTFIVGDFVSDGRRKGIVQAIRKDFHNELEVAVYFHNGMKIRVDSRKPNKLKKISREEFLQFIKKTGYTSFYDKMPKS